MEMPTSCAECDAEGHYENSYGDEYGFFCPFGYKAYTEKTRDVKRLDACPLVPVPPHGRLIDADALDIERREEQAWIDYNVDHHNEYLEGVKDGLHEAAKQLSLAPTIIPADPSKEE